VAGERHASSVAQAMARRGIPVLGALPRGRDIELPERHLGLVQAQETDGIEILLDRIADAVAAAVDIDAVVAAAQRARVAPSSALAAIPPPGQRIALAQDQAFSFIYPHLIAAWRAAGAEIIAFSPLADEAPDAACDAVWLPGGYPELHAAAIANATRFKAALRGCADRGVAVHGECGGYMVLGSGLVSADGARHEMAGLLGLETSFAKRRLHLGYRRARCQSAGGAAQAGGDLLGHEFHYATVLSNPDAPFAEIADAGGVPLADGGARRGSVSGTFFHLIDCAA
jgi:cobyrinic acid a,c-diamide synthase